MILSTYILALSHQMQGEGEESEATNHAMQTPHLMRTLLGLDTLPNSVINILERSSLRKSVILHRHVSAHNIAIVSTADKGLIMALTAMSDASSSPVLGIPKAQCWSKNDYERAADAR
jgi:hypothetical protein